MENILENLILYFSNIWIGIGIAVLVAALLFCLALIIPGRRPTPFTYIICLLLIPPTAYQVSRIYGAYTLSDYLQTLVSSANYVSSGVSSLVPDLQIEDNDLIEILSVFIPEANEIQDFISGLANQGSKIVEEANDYIKSYIINRILWLSSFMVTAVLFLFFSLSKENSIRVTNRRTSDRSDNSRHRSRTKRNHRY